MSEPVAPECREHGISVEVARLVAAARDFRDAQAAWEASGTPRPAKVDGRWQPEPSWDAMRGAELDLLDAAMALPRA